MQEKRPRSKCISRRLFFFLPRISSGADLFSCRFVRCVIARRVAPCIARWLARRCYGPLHSHVAVGSRPGRSLRPPEPYHGAYAGQEDEGGDAAHDAPTGGLRGRFVDLLDGPGVAVGLDDDVGAEADVEEGDQQVGILLGGAQDVLLLHDEPGGNAPDPQQDVVGDDVDGDLGALELREQRYVRADVVAAVHQGDHGDLQDTPHASGLAGPGRGPILRACARAVAREQQAAALPEPEQDGQQAEEADRFGGEHQRHGVADHADDHDDREPGVLADGDLDGRQSRAGGRLGEERHEHEYIVNIRHREGRARLAQGRPELHGVLSAARIIVEDGIRQLADLYAFFFLSSIGVGHGGRNGMLARGRYARRGNQAPAIFRAGCRYLI